MACEHTHIDIAAAVLRSQGRIGGFDAVYDLVCPWDGTKRRDTRLASTIWRLRNRATPWDIETVDRPGLLAEYVLVKEGSMDVGSEVYDGHNPPTVEQVPEPERALAWKCTAMIPLYGKGADKGKVISSSPCVGTRTEMPAEALLGGWRRGYCSVCKDNTAHRPLAAAKQAT